MRELPALFSMETLVHVGIQVYLKLIAIGVKPQFSVAVDTFQVLNGPIKRRAIDLT